MLKFEVLGEGSAHEFSPDVGGCLEVGSPTFSSAACDG